jgi:iron uptake system component EfeO
MKRFLICSFVIAGCGSDGMSDADHREAVTAEMHDSIAVELGNLEDAARALQEAAPPHAWDATTDAAAITAMRTAWRNTRIAYEHVEGAIAPLFPDVDFAIDARYDDYLAEAAGQGDPNAFDASGATGMHSIERILFADHGRDEVVDFESTLPGYAPAAFPTSDADAVAFKAELVGKLITDVQGLRAQWQPANIDIGAAFVGLVGLMNEQKEKVDLAATGEEESRYANVTLFDLRNNLEGTRQVYAAFRAWIATKDGGDAADGRLAGKFDTLAAAYVAAGDNDSLPEVPATWSSDMPSQADLATPFGTLWKTVHDDVDPNNDGSIVAEMNALADLLGFPEFVEE